MVEFGLYYEHDTPDIPSTHQCCLVLAEPNRTTSLNGRMPWLEFQKLRFLIKQDHDKKQILILSILFLVWASSCLLKSISSLIRFRPFGFIKQHGLTKGITSSQVWRNQDQEKIESGSRPLFARLPAHTVGRQDIGLTSQTWIDRPFEHWF